MFAFSSSTSSCPPAPTVPVLERPWAIQRIMLFCVGPMSPFSLEKSWKLANVGSLWNETFWELGTKDFVIPKNFISNSISFTSPYFGSNVSASSQNAGAAAAHSISLGSLDQQEIIASDSSTIMERCLMNERSIKYTKRIRRAFLNAGFDPFYRNSAVGREHGLRNLPQFLEASCLAPPPPSASKTLSPSKQPIFQAIYAGDESLTILQQSRSDLLSVPRGDSKYLDVTAIPLSRKIPDISSVVPIAAQASNNNNNNYPGYTLSQPTISPDGRFIAYCVWFTANNAQLSKSIAIFYIGGGKNSFCKPGRNGADDDDSECDDDDDFTSNNKNKNKSTFNDSDDDFLLSGEKILMKEQKKKRREMIENSVLPSHRCIGWISTGSFVTSEKHFNNVLPQTFGNSSVAFSKDSETLFFTTSSDFCLRCAVFDQKTGKFTVPSQNDKSAPTPQVLNKIHAYQIPKKRSDGTDGMIGNNVRIIQPCQIPQNMNLHRLATLGDDGVIGIWSYQQNKRNENDDDDKTSSSSSTIKPLFILKPHVFRNNGNVPVPIIHAAFFTYARKIATIDSNSQIRIFDISTAASATASSGTMSSIRAGVEVNPEAPINITCGVSVAAFSQYDDSYYAAGHRYIDIIDIQARTRKCTIVAAGRHGVNGLAFPPHTSQILLSASGHDRKISVWQIEPKNGNRDINNAGVLLKTISTDFFNGFGCNFLSSQSNAMISLIASGGKQQLFSLHFAEGIVEKLALVEPLLSIKKMDGRRRKITVEGFSGEEYVLSF